MVPFSARLCTSTALTSPGASANGSVTGARVNLYTDPAATAEHADGCCAGPR